LRSLTLKVEALATVFSDCPGSALFIRRREGPVKPWAQGALVWAAGGSVSVACINPFARDSMASLGLPDGLGESMVGVSVSAGYRHDGRWAERAPCRWLLGRSGLADFAQATTASGGELSPREMKTVRDWPGWAGDGGRSQEVPCAGLPMRKPFRFRSWAGELT
jgi:hypothetical protein